MFVRKTCLVSVLALIAATLPAHAQSRPEPRCVFHTNLGDIRVDLLPDAAPKTVANFLQYVSSGAYNSSFFHRSAAQGLSIIQGGGFTVDANVNVNAIPVNAAVVNEYSLPNVRGTLAMAKQGGNPDSATDQWFFNVIDDTDTLGPSNNGGFTVFGRIADSSSLAVMDAIKAEPVYDASSYFNKGALSELPLVNYQTGNVVYANFITVSSITTPYTAAQIAAGPDGKTRILWIRGDGAATVWTLNAGGTAGSYSPLFGPFAGWTATALSVGPDNGSRILWTKADGSATLWTLPSGSSTPSYGAVYGPYAGWSAQSLSVGADGSTRLLWDNADGRATVWTVPASGSPAYGAVFGPIAGWTAQSVSVGPDNAAHLLWNTADGRATLWTVPSGSTTASYGPVYGPLSGWTAMALSVDAGGSSHLLWDNADGRMTLWTVPASGSPSYGSIFGPYADWTASGVTVTPDGNSHVLWDNADGRMTPWTLNANSQFVGSFPTYGPY